VGPYDELRAFVKKARLPADAHHIVGGEHLRDLGSSFSYEKAPAVAIDPGIHEKVITPRIAHEQDMVGGRRGGRAPLSAREVESMYRAAYTEQAEFPELATIAGNITRQSTAAGTRRAQPAPSAKPQSALPPLEERPAGRVAAQAVMLAYEAEQQWILAHEWDRIEADIDSNSAAAERWRSRGEWVALYVFVEEPAGINVLEFVYREPWELPRYRFSRLVHGPDAQSVARPPEHLEAPAKGNHFLAFQVLPAEKQVPYVPFGHQAVSLPGDFVNEDGDRTMHLEIVEGEPKAAIHSLRGKLTVTAARVHLPEISGLSSSPSPGPERDDLYIELTLRDDSGELFRSRLRTAPDGLKEELLSVSSGRTSRSFWRQQ
jgi:hypothetical protein